MIGACFVLQDLRRYYAAQDGAARPSLPDLGTTFPPVVGYFEFLIRNLDGRAALLRGLGRPAGRPYQSQ